jgi:hypothetical protein
MNKPQPEQLTRHLNLESQLTVNQHARVVLFELINKIWGGTWNEMMVVDSNAESLNEERLTYGRWHRTSHLLL